MTVPQCYRNESSIDECSGTVANECSPVLVDCGFMVSGDENSGGVLAASVTVPAPVPECSPVLVDCGVAPLTSGGHGNNVILYTAAVVSLLLVVLAVVCATLIGVWKKYSLFGYAL